MSRASLACALLAISGLLISCVDDATATTDDPSATDEAADDSVASNEEETSSDLTCALAADTYTPYASGGSPTGTPVALPWHGFQTTYPAGAEDFRGYGTTGATVECSNAKDARSHVDVTAGCLQTVGAGTAARGKIQTTSGGAFRALALAFEGTDVDPVKWTDQSVEYRFNFAKWTAAGVNPGFKAFARYRSEDDLYVASWRKDGIVQIQKKQCGAYTLLKKIDFGPPSPNTWHTLRFDAIGNELVVYLDGERVLATTDGTFSWGTVGIRTDATDGAFLDDWRVR